MDKIELVSHWVNYTPKQVEEFLKNAFSQEFNEIGVIVKQDKTLNINRAKH